MKIKTETLSRAVDSEKLSTGLSWKKRIVLFVGDGAYEFEAKDAVALWRCLVGERNEANVPYVTCSIVGTHDEVLLVSYEGKNETWTLAFGNDFRVLLDADEAYAIAWALKRRVEESLGAGDDGSWTYSFKTSSLSHVWVLASKIALTGDCSVENESERIGGGERVFMSEETARGAVREYLRELVNGAYPESHWENEERSVDDILDEIMSESTKGGYWTHDGLTCSFEVTLCRRDVEP